MIINKKGQLDENYGQSHRCSETDSIESYHQWKHPIAISDFVYFAQDIGNKDETILIYSYYFGYEYK